MTRRVSPNQSLEKSRFHPDSEDQQAIADIAFHSWVKRCFQQDGSPEESLLAAILEVTFLRGLHVGDAGVFLIRATNEN